MSTPAAPAAPAAPREQFAFLAGLDPHAVKGRIVTVTAVDPSTGTCTIDPNDGELVGSVPYYLSTPLVGDPTVALQFSGMLAVLGGGGDAAAGGEIPASANLNTYTTPGAYTQSSTAEAQSGTNYPPPPIAGLLEVFANGSNMVWQRFTSYSGHATLGGFIWERGLYNGVWSTWQIVGGEPGLPDPADAYVAADQNITATVRQTETPAAVRATVANPHPTKRLLCRVNIQCWAAITSVTATTAMYLDVKVVSGGAVGATAGVAGRDEQVAVAGLTYYKSMIAEYTVWVPALGTVVVGTACSRSGTGAVLTIRYTHTSVTPLRWEG